MAMDVCQCFLLLSSQRPSAFSSVSDDRGEWPADDAIPVYVQRLQRMHIRISYPVLTIDTKITRAEAVQYRPHKGCRWFSCCPFGQGCRCDAVNLTKLINLDACMAETPV
jgi:hypothetical protein